MCWLRYFFNVYAGVVAVADGSAATIIVVIVAADVTVIGSVAVIVFDAVTGSVSFVGDIVSSCFVVFVGEKCTL